MRTKCFALFLLTLSQCAIADQLSGCYAPIDRVDTRVDGSQTQIPFACKRLYSDGQYLSECPESNGLMRINRYTYEMDASSNELAGVYTSRLDSGSGTADPLPVKEEFSIKNGQLLLRRKFPGSKQAVQTRFAKADMKGCSGMLGQARKQSPMASQSGRVENANLGQSVGKTGSSGSSGASILGFNVGDPVSATAEQAAALRDRGFSASVAKEFGTQRSIGSVFKHNSLGHLLVITDDRKQNVKALHRGESFAIESRPLLDVFYESIQSKFSISKDAMQSVMDQGTWFTDQNGKTMMQQQCVNAVTNGAFAETVRVQYGYLSENVGLVDPKTVILNADGSVKCARGYHLERQIAVFGAGFNQTLVTGYTITAIDMQLVARDGVARDMNEREQARAERERAVKAGAKPNL